MDKEPEPTFETALNRVERIVADLERGESSLSVALAKYEDGVKLLRFCYDLLDRAERSVALLTGVDDQGRPTTDPFDAAATTTRESDPTPSAATGAGAATLDRQSAPRFRAAETDPAATPDLPF
jgi:exodeoxyribonuclease VII small subunit